MGPSAINPIGSSVTDAFSRFFQAALEQSFAEFGIKATLYETGPMSFGIAFPEGMSLGMKKQVLQRTNEIFIEKMPSNLDVKGVSSYHTDTVMQSRFFVLEELFGSSLTSDVFDNGQRLLGLLRVKSELVVDALKKAGVDQATISAVRKADWVDSLKSIDVIRYALFKNGATPEGINLLFEISGLPYRKGERGPAVSRPAKDLVRLETGDPQNPLRRIPTAEEEYLVSRLREDKAYQSAREAGDTNRMHLIAENFAQTQVPTKLKQQARELSRAFKRGFNERTDPVDLQLFMKKISILKNENPEWTDYRASLEVFHKMKQGLFEEPLLVRKEASDLLALAQGRPLVERKAATSEQKTFANAMLNDPRFKAAKTDGERYKIATEYASVLLNTTSAERALIVENLSKGSRLENAVGHAFYDNYKIEGNRPGSSEDFISLAGRLDNLTPTLRRKALSKIEDATSKRVYDVLDQLLLYPDNPQKQKAIMQEWQRAMDVEEQHKLHSEVIKEREKNPQAVRNEELELLRSQVVEKQIKDAGIRPSEMPAAYEQGYGKAAQTDLQRLDNARKGVLEKLGVKLGQKVERPDEIFDLILKGGLSERIRSLEGFEGAEITHLEGLGGTRGAYIIEVQVKGQKRTVLLKVEDGQPADFGAQRAQGEGLVAPRILRTEEYSTGLKDPRTGKAVIDKTTGKPITQKYYLMENVHDFAPAPQKDVVLGKRRSGTVEVEVVGKVSEAGREVDVDLIVPGDKPGEFRNVAAGTIGKDGKKATVRSVALFSDAVRCMDPSNAATADLWRLLSTPKGRELVLQAQRAYHERSRRALMFDRRTANTALFLIEYEGNYYLTFQPIDTDGVGNRIGIHPETRQPNFNHFYSDFANRANMGVFGQEKGFLRFLSERSSTAVNAGLLDATFIFSDLVNAATSDTARVGARIPMKPARVEANAQSFAGYDGNLGNGYSAFNAIHLGSVHGTYTDFGGEKRLISREDGRIPNNGKQMERVYRMANTSREQNLFATYADERFISGHADYLAFLSSKIEDGTLRPEQLGKYREYIESARKRIESGEEAKTVYSEESNRMLKGQLPGLKEAPKAATGR